MGVERGANNKKVAPKLSEPLLIATDSSNAGGNYPMAIRASTSSPSTSAAIMPDLNSNSNRQSCKCHSYHVAVYALVLIAWLVAGTATFHFVESPSENDRRRLAVPVVEEATFDLTASTTTTLNKPLFLANDSVTIVNVSLVTVENKQETFKLVVHFYQRNNENGSQAMSMANGNSNKGKLKWDVTGSLLFCVGLLATVGYGSLAPTTGLGRIFCVVFSCVGIPIFLVIAAELRRLLSDLCHRLAKSCCRSRPGPLPTHSNNNFRYVNGGNANNSPGFLETVIILSTALLISGIFIVAPAFLFQFLEGWDFPLALYFSFVSLTTIGFGDLLASMDDAIDKYGEPSWTISVYRIFISAWIFFGVVVLATLFGTVYEILSRRLNSRCTHQRTTAGTTN